MSDQPDDLSYEDFDDLEPPDDTGLEPLDLDALDDDLEPVEAPGDAAEDLLDMITGLDDATPAPEPEPDLADLAEAVQPEPEPDLADLAEAVQPEPEPAAPDAPEAAPDMPGEAAAESKPDVIYRVMIMLPDDLAGQVDTLRTATAIADMPPPGIDLAAAFRTDQIEAVQQAVADWARNHLPVQIEITGVLAEVIGARQYVAAWMLQPDEELAEAQHTLRHALAPLIAPLPDAPAAFHVRVTIGDHVAAKPYPTLIGQMQRDFEPYVWHAERVALIRSRPDEAPQTWETIESYR